MAKIGGNRNFGYGKQLAFAGKSAIKGRFIVGHFGSVAAHFKRWVKFCNWCKSLGIRDARELVLKHVEMYGLFLRDKVDKGEISVRYAQNLVSTVNVILSTMRGDNKLKVSPAKLLGSRTSIRTEAPLWMNRTLVQQIIDRLVRSGERHVAAMVAVARDLGLRIREACLLNARAALTQAMKNVQICVERGVKGGNNARFVPIMAENQLETLRFAAETQGSLGVLMGVGVNGNNCRNYKNWLDYAYTAFYAAGGKHFHDLRASYACDRYFELTGCLAPVLRGGR